MSRQVGESASRQGKESGVDESIGDGKTTVDPSYPLSTIDSRLWTPSSSLADSPTRRLADSTRVCIVGNLCVDLVMRGVGALPEWGEEVVGTGHEARSAGQGFNLAAALARLGADVSLVSVVGDDAFGRQILADLDRLGVEWAGVEVVAGPTGLTVAAVRPDGERAFLSSFGSQARLDPDLLQRQAGRIEAAGVVCLVGQFCLPTLSTTAAATLLGRVRARGATTLLDTGWDPAGWPPASVDAVRDLLPTVDLFLPNADEARALSGEPDPAAAATKFRADGAGVVAVKLGADGSLAVAADGEHRAAALPVAALDAVGAGDTFDAGFLRALMLGHDVPQALALGNSAAGLYVSRAGDRWPTWDELVGAAGRD